LAAFLERLACCDEAMRDHQLLLLLVLLLLVLPLGGAGS
jgi:hypothetical protein